jgi:hypothetical protein
MSAWRRIAIEKLPQFKQKIEHSESIGMLWIDLFEAFRRAHEDRPDEATIRQIYDFAWWAAGEAANDDIRSATVCAFFEHLPTDGRVRELMPQYMTREQFLGMKEVFKYFLSPDQHREFVDDFLRRRRLIEEAVRRKSHSESA